MAQVLVGLRTKFLTKMVFLLEPVMLVLIIIIVLSLTGGASTKAKTISPDVKASIPFSIWLEEMWNSCTRVVTNTRAWEEHE